MSENTVVQISKIQIEVIFEIFHVAKMELTDNCVFVKFDFKLIIPEIKLCNENHVTN